MLGTAIKSYAVFPLSIPLKRTVSHAASHRDCAEPVVFAVELLGNIIGYGETLPREYVTGESVQDVLNTIDSVFGPRLLEMRPAGFPEALEAIDALPFHDDTGKPIPAARAAVELALLDAYSRRFQRPIDEAAGWLGLNEFGPPGSLHTVRHSGVLASTDPSKLRRQLRLMWWFGLRDFKLKVAMPDDADRMAAVARYLRRPLAAARATLRLDANGAWSPSEAESRLRDWRQFAPAYIEQPLPKGCDSELPALHAAVDTPFMHDESLVLEDDAARLVELGVADAFNIRLSKCGGLLPSLKLARFARKQGVAVQLGCMVGETSILSAAGRKFIQLVPKIRFVEGAFGKLLLADDVVERPLQFGYRGKVAALTGWGWGIQVDGDKLRRLAGDRAYRVEF